MKANKKKDFSNINTNRVYDTIAEATAAGDSSEQLPGQMVITDIEGNIAEEEPTKKKYKDRKTYTAAEQILFLEAMQTSGKKGVKLPRINLAFTPANYEFIKIMAQVRGQSLTEFVNDMLTEARTQHADIYEKAIEFRNSL